VVVVVVATQEYSKANLLQALMDRLLQATMLGKTEPTKPATVGVVGEVVAAGEAARAEPLLGVIKVAMLDHMA
jgi:hypothetical protein